MTSFAGIPFAALDFYEDLEADNTKSFWAAHKDVYAESVRAPLEALLRELEPEFGSGKLFRPYRDVRFSKDKTAYKTHQGVVIEQPNRAGFYLQIDPAGLMVAAGRWWLTSAEVDRFRRAVADDVAGGELARRIAAVRRTGFEVGGDTITRVPPGYDRDHPRAELLRHKSLTARRHFGCPDWVRTRRAKSEIVKAWHRLEPLTSWLDTHVSGSENLNEATRTG